MLVRLVQCGGSGNGETLSERTVMTNLLETNWELHVQSVKWAANSLTYRVFPELAERARREAEEFSKLPAPKDPSEMALMVARSSILQGSWSNEFLTRAALQANAEMMANTQKVVDTLLPKQTAR
jgi:hypothetical protein